MLTNKTPEVDVLIYVYNHEKFLRRCLDSVLNQKTEFPFRLLIHDDCSSDGSIPILKEYERKYPDKLLVIYEDENQWSKGANVTKIIEPYIEGRFVAMCEADDYWCSDKKLQAQYDCMIANPDAVMCVHNSVIHDLSGEEEDRKFSKWSSRKTLESKDVFFGWNVHFSSYFIRTPYDRRPDRFYKYWFGDFVLLTCCYNYGTIIYMPDLMSVYNANNPNGFTRSFIDEYTIAKKKEMERVEYLREFDDFTEHKHHSIIQERIEDIEFYIFYREKFGDIIRTKSLRSNFAIGWSIVRHKSFKDFMRRLSVSHKIKFLIKAFFGSLLNEKYMSFGHF